MSDDLWVDEQWCAEGYAELVSDQIEKNPSVYHSWNHDFDQLSELQTDYEANPVEGPRLACLAFRILYPRLGKYGARAVINSAGDRSSRIKLTAHRRTLNTELTPWMANIMRRLSSLTKQEQIGGAALLAYRECGKTEDAYEMVSDGWINGNLYDGEPDVGWGKPDKVKAYYQSHRRECFERGFADIRRVHAILSGTPPPENPLMLSDFPTPAKST